jgi:hypothetical protein
MVTLTSSTEPVTEMKAALEAHGQIVSQDSPETSSVPSETPGVLPATGPEGESAPASEAGQQQETQAAPPNPAQPNKGRRGDFESRRVRLEKERDRFRDDLEHEREERSRLADELAVATSELAKLKPVEPQKEPELVRPAMPAFPRRESDDYDGSKYEQALADYQAALDKYSVDMGEYQVKFTERTVQSQLAKREEERKQAEAEATANRKHEELRARISEEAKTFEDYQELVEAMPEDPIPTNATFDAAIMDSEHPALLMRHFMIDHLDNNGTERDRIMAMTPIRMVRAIAEIENKLLTEKPQVAAPPTAPVAAPVAAAPSAVSTPERPARPKFTPPAAPIEPVGSRSTASTASLGVAKSALEYAKLRGAGVNR